MSFIFSVSCQAGYGYWARGSGSWAVRASEKSARAISNRKPSGLITDLKFCPLHAIIRYIRIRYMRYIRIRYMRGLPRAQKLSLMRELEIHRAFGLLHTWVF